MSRRHQFSKPHGFSLMRVFRRRHAGKRSSALQPHLTTKLAAESKSYAEAWGRIDGSLKTLGMDHIDLMLIHSPQPCTEFSDGGHFDGCNLDVSPPAAHR
ncbi:putative oxidoreductase (fragment) [Hyphomicrobium sp. GJ21]|jgi:aryl-alcohol dehydrogenase-like predicted oxidoreductase|uniref:hypothetical protein n=1 Tax=Bradyrhizobium sp. CCH5-F6 TaxID=1768753 RepID=UPI000622C174